MIRNTWESTHDWLSTEQIYKSVEKYLHQQFTYSAQSSIKNLLWNPFDI